MNSDDRTKALQAFIEHYEARMMRRDFQFRFAVGSPEQGYSTVWGAWAWGNEFYIAARAMMGSTKISLHQSGNCRLAINEEKWKELAARGLPLPDDRAFTKWKRKPTPEAGAVHVASVLFPTDYLRNAAAPQGTAKRPLKLFTPAPPGGAVEVSFFYSREASETLEAKFAKLCLPLLRVTLDNGESVSIMVRKTEFDNKFLPPPEKLEKLSGPVHIEMPAGTEMSDLTAAVWNSPVEDGTGTLIIAEIGGVALRRTPQKVPEVKI
jgi:hypothetical protein